MLVDLFLNNLSKEIGFKFGTPWRYSDNALGVVVPILREGYSEERGYLTLEEAKDKGVIFKDSGHIDKVIIESSLGTPIFIRSGTALKGIGTQPRAVEISTVVVPDINKDIKKEVPVPIITTAEIPVRCIYASKAIRSGSKFAYSGDVPLGVRSALISRRSQAETWDAVKHTTYGFMSTSASHGHAYGTSSNKFASIRSTSDDLVGVMEEVDKFQSNVDEILKKVPIFEDQVGAVFLDMKDVVGLELFDSPKSWEAIHKEVEKRLGESISKEEEQTFFKPDYTKVKSLALLFLKKLIESEKIETSSNNIVSTISLRGDGVIGEATTINGKVIHLVGIKDDKKPNDKLGNVTTHIRSARDIFSHIGDTVPTRGRDNWLRM